MYIGSAEWYEAHPDAPTPGEAEEDLAFEREARRRGWKPNRTNDGWATAREQSLWNGVPWSQED